MAVVTGHTTRQPCREQFNYSRLRAPLRYALGSLVESIFRSKYRKKIRPDVTDGAVFYALGYARLINLLRYAPHHLTTESTIAKVSHGTLLPLIRNL
jgi:hypothetical protein